MENTRFMDFLTVMAAFCMNGIELGPIKSFGPFFIQFQNDLNASASQSSLVTSLLFGSYFMAGPVASLLTARLGFRRTFFVGAMAAATGAIICSFARTIVAVQVLIVLIGGGCGLGSVPKFAVIGRRFTKKRSLANNVVTMGSALVTIPLPILIQYWNIQYTWRGSILILGAIFLNIIPFGMLLTVDIDARESEKTQLFNTELLKNWKFICYVISCGCNLSAMTAISVYLVRFGQSKGFGDYTAASMASFTSAPNLIIRPISGYLTSLTHIGPVPIVRPYVFAAIGVIQALVMIGMTFSNSLEAVIALCLAYSICVGCRGALSVTMAADFFGRDALVTSLGMRALSQGLFSVMVPPLLGIIVDATDSYNPPFYGSAILSLTAAVLTVVVHCATSKPCNEASVEIPA